MSALPDPLERPPTRPEPRSYLALVIIVSASVLLLAIAVAEAIAAQGTDKVGDAGIAARLENVNWSARAPRFALAGGIAVLAVGCVLLVIALTRRARRRPILQDAWREDVAWVPGHAALLVGLYFLLDLALAAAMMAGVLPEDMVDPGRPALWVAQAALRGALTVGMFAVVSGAGGTLSQLGLTTRRLGRNIAIGVAATAAFLAVYVGLGLAMDAVLRFSGIEPILQQSVTLLFDPPSRAALVGSVVFAGFVAPIVEELFFRGFLQGALRRRCGSTPAIVGTALIFAAIHGNAFAFLPLFVLGLVLGYVYDRTQSLVGPMLVHAGLNLSVVAALLALGRATA